MFQTKTIYILNVQTEFQHPSDTSEIFRATFKCILRYNGSSINFRHVFEVSHNSLIEISDFGEDFKISVKISKDFNQKCARFQGVSSPSQVPFLPERKGNLYSTNPRDGRWSIRMFIFEKNETQ